MIKNKKTSKNDIEFFIPAYFHAFHGADLRRRSFWAFKFGTQKGKYVMCPEQVTFSQARAWATTEAVKRGVTLVYVCI